MNRKPWIGVDFDGTIATYSGWVGPTELGDPIPAMVKRVKNWLNDDIDVRIFTARISVDDPDLRFAIVDAIMNWCVEHIGVPLMVTNVKDFDMIELYDDRAVQVEENTGHIIGYSSRGLL